jgi:uncharacterized membrane protein YfcA
MEDLSFAFVSIRLVIGLIIGVVIGMTGVGGGVLVMPALTAILGLPASLAVGTASLYAFLTKAYAVFEHHRLKTIQWGVSLLFLGGAIPGAVVASLVVLRLANQSNAAAVQAFQGTLKNIIAWAMVMAAAMLIYNLFVAGKKKSGDNPTSQGGLSGSKKIIGLLCGLVVGILIGATSVGGGVLVIPLLVMFFSLNARQTVGSSILIAVVLTLITSLLYSKGGNLDYVTAICMWLGSLGGVFVGSRLAVKVPNRALHATVVVVICVATALMFIGKGGGH